MEQRSHNERAIIGRRSQQWIGLGAVFLICLAFALAWSHYRTPVFDPQLVLHGANLQVRSWFSKADAHETSEQIINVTAVQKAQSLADKSPTQNNMPRVARVAEEVDAKQLRNSLANTGRMQKQSRQDQARLSNTQQQLLNSRAILDGMQDELGATTAYAQTQQQDSDALTSSLSDLEKVPSEQDVNALISNQTQGNNQTPSGLPAKVLNNVQQSTGISPEEINQLMNE